MTIKLYASAFSPTMRLSLRDRIRKRREEEDDDMMLFIFPALYLMSSARGGERRNVILRKKQARLKFIDSSRDMSRTVKLHLGWNHTSLENWQIILEAKGLLLILG